MAARGGSGAIKIAMVTLLASVLLLLVMVVPVTRGERVIRVCTSSQLKEVTQDICSMIHKRSVDDESTIHKRSLLANDCCQTGCSVNHFAGLCN